MMNKTCKSLKHMGLWSRITLASFVPAYPTSIRGSNDNTEQTPRGTE
jgi:hypothetical protein